MAISTRRKNMIIADWKTGKFSSVSSLANHYKVDRKTVKKITEGILPTNADIVEVGAMYENAKKSLKNPVEIKAVEKAVEERTVADEIEGLVFDTTLINVRGIKKDLLPTKNEKGEDKDPVLAMQDRKIAQEALDKALITAGKVPRHASSPQVAIQNNLTQNNYNELSEEEIEKELKARGLPIDII